MNDPTTYPYGENLYLNLTSLCPTECAFCGYGESTYRLDAVLELSARLNTVGLGSLIWERDIVPDLAQVVTSVNISLNTAEPGQWRTLLRPRPEFRDRGFDSVIDVSL